MRLYIKQNNTLKSVRAFSKSEIIPTPSYDAVFGNNSWALIKQACQNNEIPATWLIGDTKSFVGTDGNTYNVRFSDKQAGRYTYADNSKVTHGAFEFVEVLPSTYQWNTTNTNVGGFASSLIQTTLNSTIINILPDELKNLLENITIKSSTGGTTYTGQSTSANKLFLLGYNEVTTKSLTPQYQDETVNNGITFGRYDYYNTHTTGSDRIKYEVGTSTAQAWWLKSPKSGVAVSASSVFEGGVVTNFIANYNFYVSPVWAW